ncbi:MAG TPA: PAC2 family protein [Ktedonobacteraceae bacterium]|nr:PAC2 family protein [Ktedonobacteraceae bacterium]
MAFVHYHKKPELRSPIVVAAFSGWNDAAEAATTAVKFLIDRWKTVCIAEIEAEEFYVFNESRPTVQTKKGQVRSISWPTNRFYAFVDPIWERDVILFTGVEPQLKWKTFSSAFMEVCKRFNVSEVLLLGAFLANIPHTRDVPVTGYSSTPEMLERMDEINVQGSRYEGPTGITGVIHDAISRAKIPVSSLWAAAPHYLVATPNIKVTSALLTYLNTFLAFDLDLSDFQNDAIRFEEQISALVARDPEASAYVRKLESETESMLAGDEEDEEDEDKDENARITPDKPPVSGPLPSADSLIRSVEELLRNERKNNHSDSDEEQE